MAVIVDVIRAVASATPCLCVLNGVPPRGPRQPQARQVLTDLGDPVGSASLGLCAAIDYAAAPGNSAQDYEPCGKATTEIATVYDVVRHAARLVDWLNSPLVRLPRSPLVHQSQ